MLSPYYGYKWILDISKVRKERNRKGKKEKKENKENKESNDLKLKHESSDVKKVSLLEDDQEAFIFNASFVNDFDAHYYDEFWFLIYKQLKKL